MKPVAAASSQGPDVHQLASESLSAGVFPVARTTEFRVFFDPHVYAAMLAHASEDVSVEICGVLVGDLCRDADGPFANVRNYIRCDSAEKKFAEVTFTHESWAHINREMDTKFQDQRIVGWYHSHPNFGIFLSDRDFFIQQNFFSGPGQIALVIDPVRKIEGVFEWRNGVTAPTPHYWVGSRMQFAPGASTAAEEAMPDETAPARPTAPESAPSTTILLAGMGLFLMGWFLADWRTGADRRALVEGTVAHYGMWKGLRPGLEEGLARLQIGLERVMTQTRALSEDHLKQSGDAAAAEKSEETRKNLQKVADKLGEEWKKTRAILTEMDQDLDHLHRQYALTPQEQDAINRVILQKLHEVQAAESAARQRTAKPAESKANVRPKKNDAKKDSPPAPAPAPAPAGS